MTQTFEILNFGHCDLFVICYLGFVIYYCLHSTILRQITFHVDWLIFLNMLAFTAFLGGDAGVLVEIILFVLAAVVYQKVFFFIDEG